MSSPGTVNSVTLTGEISSKVKLTYVQDGEIMAEFALAVTGRQLQDKSFHRIKFYFDVVVFGGASYIESSAVRGAKIFVHGQLRQRKRAIANETFLETIVVGNQIVMLKPPVTKKTKEYE